MPYLTSQPPSISILIETNDVCANPGTICAALAAGGKSGLSISHSCVDVSFPPSGWLMHIGIFVTLMLTAGAPGWRKFPVAPASAIHTSIGMSIVVVALYAPFFFGATLPLITVISSSSTSLSSKMEKALWLFRVGSGMYNSNFELVITLL